MIGCAILLAVLAGCGESESPSSAYPRRPIKLIVPFSPGGGTDTFARILQTTINDDHLLPQPLVIINVPGAGATIGSRRVKNARPDGYTLLILHEGLLTAKALGQASYGAEAFEPIAGTGEVGMVIAVAEDAPYESLTELLDAAAATPDEIVFSVNIGAMSHFAGLQLEQARPGARFRYTQNGSGTERFASVKGGHSSVSAFSLAEYVQFHPAGLRALALLGEKRHEAIPEVPTAAEQGYHVVSANMHFWWAPKGTSRERLDVIADALQRAMQSPAVREKLAQTRTDPVYLTGDALRTSLDERIARISSVSQRPTTDLPDFPLLALAAVGLFAALSAWHAWRERQSPAENTTRIYRPGPARRAVAIACVAVTALYVFAMQFEWAGYRLATLFYVTAVGALLTGRDARKLPAVGLTAVVLSLGLHFVFTRLFVIDLP